MLLMAARQVGYPVVFFILMISDDLLLHEICLEAPNNTRLASVTIIMIAVPERDTGDAEMKKPTVKAGRRCCDK